MGRTPVGDMRVGCNLRSPGRKAGLAPGIEGRGRWKIGCPGTGRPGAERCPIGCPGCTVARGWTGAKYTGRGPVWGVITRRTGGGGVAGFCIAGGATAAGVEAAVAGGRDTAFTGGAAGITGAACAGGTCGGEASGGAGFSAPAGLSEAGVSGIGFSETGAAGLGGGAGCSTAAGAAGLAAAGITGLAGAGAACFATGGGAISVVVFLMALSTSPGLEILERSILVLISSGAAALERAFSVEAALSDSPWKCLRTRSTRSASSELEWLFLSSMPMVGR